MLSSWQCADIINSLLRYSRGVGASNVQIVADGRGFIYQDDGRGLHTRADFAALLIGEEPEAKQDVAAPHRVTGQCIYALLAQDEVEAVNIASNMLYLALDARRWRTDKQYATDWQSGLQLSCFPALGISIGVTCAQELAARFIQTLTPATQTERPAAQSSNETLHLIINVLTRNA